MPNFTIEAGATYLLDYYGVGFPQGAKVLAGDLSEKPDRQSRAGKRMFQKYLVGKTQVFADAADFVFEEVAEGFDEGKRHVFGKAADIVMGLDGGRGAFYRDGFDDVRIERALDQPSNLAVGFVGLEFLGFFGEDGDEFPADDFALLLGVGDASQALPESGRRRPRQ